MSDDAEPLCAVCREPWRPEERQRFCVTCDRWLHADCLERHAAVEPDGDGDWRHAPPEPCRECGEPVDPREAVRVGTPPQAVHVGVCFDTWIAARLAVVRTAVGLAGKGAA